MSTALMIEIFGYIGCIFVIISMLMTSVVKLRVINTVGSSISAVSCNDRTFLPIGGGQCQPCGDQYL